MRAVTFNNLGCFYHKRGKLHAALQALDKALRIELSCSQVGHRLTDRFPALSLRSPDGSCWREAGCSRQQLPPSLGGSLLAVRSEFPPCPGGSLLAVRRLWAELVTQEEGGLTNHSGSRTRLPHCTRRHHRLPHRSMAWWELTLGHAPTEAQKEQAGSSFVNPRWRELVRLPKPTPHLTMGLGEASCGAVLVEGSFACQGLRCIWGSWVCGGHNWRGGLTSHLGSRRPPRTWPRTWGALVWGVPWGLCACGGLMSMWRLHVARCMWTIPRHLKT